MKLYNKTNFVTLQEYQAQEGLPANKIGKYFSVSEKAFKESKIIYTPLISFLDHLRETLGSPLIVTSLYRNEAKQARLRASGAPAVTHSPHLYGCAADISLNGYNPDEVYTLVKKIAKSDKRKIRVGFLQYNKSFLHFDFCPEVFGKGGIYEYLPFIPSQFKSEIEW